LHESVSSPNRTTTDAKYFILSIGKTHSDIAAVLVTGSPIPDSPGFTKQCRNVKRIAIYPIVEHEPANRMQESGRPDSVQSVVVSAEPGIRPAE